MIVSATIAVAILSPLGCGSSSSGSDASTPLTKAQFQKEANEICKQGLEEKDKGVKAAVEESNETEEGNPSAQKREEVGKSILAAYQTIQEELSELSPPKKDQPELNGLLARLDKEIGEAERDLANLTLTNHFQGSTEAARESGLAACTF